MHVSRLYIRNFRSIKALDLSLQKGKNVIVGRNNAGKSNIVKALDLVLGESSPDYSKSENVTANDFFTDGGVAATEIFIWCELTRPPEEQFTDARFAGCAGFSRCDYERRGQAQQFPSLPENYAEAFNIVKEGTPTTWVESKLRNQTTFVAELSDKHCFALGFRAVNRDGTIEKEIRLFYSESEQTSWRMAFRASIRNELIQSAILPAFRDPFQQLKLNQWSWYGKLIKHLTESHGHKGMLARAHSVVASISDRIFSSMRETVAESSLKVSFPGAQIHFQLNPDAQAELYKSCLIYIDDGFKSLLTDKGAGIQSATIIGLFTYYIQHVNTENSALLCIEEPELYLHPHARRVISDRLTEFVTGQNQVILTTHSGEFIRTYGDDVRVISVRRTSAGTTSRTVALRDYARFLVDADANEVFFADKAILCEGRDRYLIRAIADELYPGALDGHNVSIVSTGGKESFRKVGELLAKLDIECFIVADFDYFLRDGNREEAEKYNGKPKESIGSLGLWFFRQRCTFGEQAALITKKLGEIRQRIKNTEPQKFYSAKHIDALDDATGLGEVFEQCRARGLCILDGEIEGQFIDGMFSSRNKLDGSGVYRLNARLVNGEHVTDFVNCTPFRAFFKHVFAQRNAAATPSGRKQKKTPPKQGQVNGEVPASTGSAAASAPE